MKLKIAIGGDHAGFEYKKLLTQMLEAKGYEVKDFGPFSDASVDYPDHVHPLAKAGLISSEFLAIFRRHAIVVIMIVSAVVTPPDVMSMSLFAIPLYLLYELSIVIAKNVRKRDIERLNKNLTRNEA